jgi:ubiquinone/menaquinone biosynthesis methyltransferase
MALRDELVTPDRKRRYVRTLFATIADRYDFITALLSYGRDRAWKRRLVRIAEAAPGTRALDIATGTGDIATALRERGARVVGLDITPRMIELARRKVGNGAAAFVLGDMGALPFGDATFDLVTVGYGLRNAADLTRALDEIVRVLRPAGRLLSLEFDRPRNRWLRATYLMYLTIVGGAVGWMLHGDPDTYRYIPASLRRYPDREGVERMMRERGFRQVRRYPVFGGLLAIHDAVK